MKNRKFRYDMRAENGVGVINILSEIGGWGVRFEDFNAALERLGPVSEIKMLINSDGGDVFDGFAIYNALQMHPAQKTITIMGLAASMASVIAMAGDRRIMPENAMLMIHNPVGGIIGDAEEIAAYSEAVGSMREKIANVYEAVSAGKLSKKKALQLMDRQSWINADDALAYGLATEVAPAIEIAAKFDLSDFKDVPEGVLKNFGGQRLDSQRESMVNTETEFETAPKGDSAMTDKTQKPADTPAAPVVDTDALLRAERDRVKNISALCKMAGRADMAAKFIDEGTTLESAVAEVAKLGPAKDAADDVEVSNHNTVGQEAVAVLDETAIWNSYNRVQAGQRA